MAMETNPQAGEGITNEPEEPTITNPTGEAPSGGAGQGTQEPPVKEEPELEIEDPFTEIEENDDDKSLEDVDEDERKKVEAIIDKRLDKRSQGDANVRIDVGLVKLYQTENGEVYKKFEAKIKEYAKHPATKGLSFTAIANMAVPVSTWMKIGAERERNATKKAAETRGIGGSIRPQPAGDFPNPDNLSDQEFDNLTEKLKSGR